MSKAHLGVLFLDEFPLFPTDVVEALREPLEAGEISISRGDEDATYPARAMFVFACNPCRCGEYHPYSRDHQCTCGEVKRREYRAQDLRPDRRPHRHHPLRRAAPRRATDGPRAALRAARDECGDPGARHGGRERQRMRYAGMPWRLNVHAPGPLLRERWPLTDVGHGAARRRGLRRPAHPAWGRARAPGRVVGGRPRRRRPAGASRSSTSRCGCARATPLLLRQLPAPASVDAVEVGLERTHPVDASRRGRATGPGRALPHR